MKDIAGTIYFKVDGAQYSAAGSFTISLGDTQKEELVGHSGFDGFKSLPKAPFIEGVIRDFPSIDLNKLERLQGVTVTVELVSGKVATLRDASQVNSLELNSEDGTIPIKFVGKSGEYQVA